jgi:hypothetical protein
LRGYRVGGWNETESSFSCQQEPSTPTSRNSPRSAEPQRGRRRQRRVLTGEYICLPQPYARLQDVGGVAKGEQDSRGWCRLVKLDIFGRLVAQQMEIRQHCIWNHRPHPWPVACSHEEPRDTKPKRAVGLRCRGVTIKDQKPGCVQAGPFVFTFREYCRRLVTNRHSAEPEDISTVRVAQNQDEVGAHEHRCCRQRVRDWTVCSAAAQAFIHD